MCIRDSSYNVLRTRIDRFGVAQPNIQASEGKMGRIMVELPGIKEQERVRKLLQGSANLEFWETFDAQEIVPYLSSVDNRLRDILAVESLSLIHIYLIASASSAPGLNLVTFLAGIVIVAFVDGLIPVSYTHLGTFLYFDVEHFLLFF